MIKSFINHQSPPSTPIAMSILINPLPHPASILFKATLEHKPRLHSISFSTPASRKSPVCFSYSSSSSSSSFNEPSKPPNVESSSKPDEEISDNKPTRFVDEWGEKSEPEPEPANKFSGPDPPGEGADDEWGGVGVKDDGFGNGPPGVDAPESEKLRDLKRAFVDTVYGTNFGFEASTEVRAEALELIAQLEAANPTPAPTETPELLDGNWILVYTAFSELLPLLAASNLPLTKVEKICQSIDSSSLTIENSTIISSTVVTFSFSASAAFEVQSPTRIQVQFKEGSFKPPEIKSNIDLPENVDVFGQTISLSPVQQSLNPLQNALAGIARAISGQPPLKIPIPGERTKSWLLITYLDKDFRISRGDGGLFVLAREGSPLLDQ